MAEPLMSQKAPFPVAVEEGKKYFWCACGRSASQPFCDGSHKGSEFVPVAYTADSARTLYFCGCKRTASPPLCDGTHNKL